MPTEQATKYEALPDILERKPRALRVNEVADFLNISQREVYKLAAEGRIPSFRIGNCIRFDPLALARFLRGLTR